MGQFNLYAWRILYEPALEIVYFTPIAISLTRTQLYGPADLKLSLRTIM